LPIHREKKTHFFSGRLLTAKNQKGHYTVTILNMGELHYKICQQAFWFQGVSIKKRHFQCAFDDNVSAMHIMNQQTFRVAGKAPPLPLHSAVQGVGIVVALFSPKPLAWLWLFDSV
jgi:hypothetical protein